jgi:hypothetical protein
MVITDAPVEEPFLHTPSASTVTLAAVAEL